MIDDTHRSQYRLPRSLYEKLRERAQRNRRSLNNELTWRLEATFASTPSSDHPESIGAEAVHALLAEITLAELGLSSEEPHSAHYRLPRALYQKLKSASKDRGQTINEEIVERLETSLYPGWIGSLRDVLSKMTIPELLTQQALETLLPSLVEKINAAMQKPQ
ncbi:Arc family DNA-binding protein [Paraburkholderia susongensis]|uniref:Arc family DNA-binding protein n=1 Tax=Paraburkholderia susongensis TaxID=1515439 RepID=UPI001FC99983|nr:Arc family DNA-binding protein [Paraburkholderia susongensis]